MKKVTLALIAFVLGLNTYAQDTITNAKNSSYQFTEIAKLDATPVLNQGYTGTCWSFSSLSFFESEMIRKGMKNPPILSKMYIVRKDYEQKADRYIRMDGKINFGQGGEFDNIPYIFKHYGIVPSSVYNGLLYGQTKYNHQELFSGLKGYVDGILKYVNDKRSDAKLSKSWKVGLNGILDAYLGKTPEKFEYEGKEYTPKSFAEYTGLDMDDYVSITSYMNLPMNQKVKLYIPDNWTWAESYNVKLNTLEEIVVYALKHGYTVAWGADVSEKGFNFRKGIAIVPADASTVQSKGSDQEYFNGAGADKISNAFLNPVKELEITPEMRQAAYDNKTTTDDHGMHIVGLYKGANGTKYFLVKNSWGTNNLPQGYLYVSENYFKYKTMQIYLNKDALPKDVAKALNIEQ